MLTTVLFAGVVVLDQEVVGAEEWALLELGQDHGDKALVDSVAGAGDGAHGQHVAGRQVARQSDPDLLQIILALHPPRRGPGRLDGRHQQRRQDADDRDDHQQLDQGEGPTHHSLPGQKPRPAWFSGKMTMYFQVPILPDSKQDSRPRTRASCRRRSEVARRGRIGATFSTRVARWRTAITGE